MTNCFFLWKTSADGPVGPLWAGGKTSPGGAKALCGFCGLLLLEGSEMSLQWFFGYVLRARLANLQFLKTAFFFETRCSRVKIEITDFRFFSRFLHIPYVPNSTPGPPQLSPQPSPAQLPALRPSRAQPSALHSSTGPQPSPAQPQAFLVMYCGRV